jgi:hypothetical protein
MRDAQAVIELSEKADAATVKEGGTADPGSAGDPELAEKVKELYQISTKWDAVASSVPAVIERLKSLRTLCVNTKNCRLF